MTVLKRWPLILFSLIALSLAGVVWAAQETAETPSGPLARYQGSAIIFVAGDGGHKRIMIYEPGRAAPEVLADKKNVIETQPTLGPDGQAAWVRRSGKKWELISGGRVVSGGELHLSPAFRPDGALVAAVSGERDTSIYLMGQNPILLVKGQGLAVSPAFSADGHYLAYVSNESGDAQIYVARADGSAPRLLTAGEVRNTDPAWSPDGSLIAFVTDETDICVIRPDGTGLQRLTRGAGVNRKPSFSPDGRHIVFSSDRGGRAQLFIMDSGGGGQEPLLPQFGESQNAPFWGPVRPRL